MHNLITQLLKTKMDWQTTKESPFIFNALFQDKTVQLRLNDFPEEPLATLIVDGAETPLHEFPDCWTLPRHRKNVVLTREQAIPNDLISGLIAEAKEDEVGLWLIIATLRNEFGVTDAHQRRLETIGIVMKLLESGEVSAGYYNLDRSGIEVWDKPIEECVKRIEKEWTALGREPNIGDIVVFVGKR